MDKKWEHRLQGMGMTFVMFMVLAGESVVDLIYGWLS